jgi:hypothetical protein
MNENSLPYADLSRTEHAEGTERRKEKGERRKEKGERRKEKVKLEVWQTCIDCPTQ